MTQSTFGRRLLVCAGIAVLLSAWPQTASARQSPAWGPVRAGIISIRLESNKTVYRTGMARLVAMPRRSCRLTAR